MARATNALTLGLSGKVGPLVFRQQADGSPAVVASAPVSGKRKPHELERLNQQAFRQAVEYGNLVKGDRVLRALYLARRTPKLRSAYHVALTDARTPPRLLTCEVPPLPLASGQTVRILATDDFAVMRVAVRLEAADGTLLEVGEAVSADAGQPVGWWTYTVQGPLVAGNQLIATAADRPGNTATARWLLPSEVPLTLEEYKYGFPNGE